MALEMLPVPSMGQTYDTKSEKLDPETYIEWADELKTDVKQHFHAFNVVWGHEEAVKVYEAKFGMTLSAQDLFQNKLNVEFSSLKNRSESSIFLIFSSGCIEEVTKLTGPKLRIGLGPEAYRVRYIRRWTVT